MADTVERLAVLKTLHRLGGCGAEKNSWADGWDKAIDAAFTAVENLPSSERVGHWIKKPYLLGTSRFCSICGENYGMPHGIYNYCPNCGAHMEGETDETATR